MNPVHSTSPLSVAWSQPLPDALLGVALARESGDILVWDENRWLYLYDQKGERRGETQLSQPIACVCAADDGSAIVALDAQGDVHWLSHGFTTKRRHSLKVAPAAAVVDSYGQYLVVSGQKASLNIVDRRGMDVSSLQPPRACRYIAASVSRDYFVGCADYGFVGAFDLLGNWLWRDGLVVHIGGIALGGAGSPLVLACFSEGIQTYDSAGKKQTRWKMPQSIKMASVAFDGKQSFAAGGNQVIFHLDHAGQLQHTYQVDQAVSSMVCGPLGDYVIFTTGQNTLNKGRIKSPR